MTDQPLRPDITLTFTDGEMHILFFGINMLSKALRGDVLKYVSYFETTPGIIDRSDECSLADFASLMMKIKPWGEADLKHHQEEPKL